MGDGSKRNKLCPCGSGLKYKQCCLNKKPRQTAIKFDFGRNIAAQRILITDQGVFATEGDKIHAAISGELEIRYDRGAGSKGPKVIANMPVTGGFLTLPLHAYFKQYDRLFVVDTNAAEVSGVMHYVTVALEARPHETGSVREGMLSVDCKVGTLGIATSPDPKPENRGWALMLQTIWQQTPAIAERERLGIVVDSDLGSLHEYNARQKPFYEDLLLPPNVRLIYASAEVKDTPLNRLIEICDLAAREQLHRLRSGLALLDNMDLANKFLIVRGDRLADTYEVLDGAT